MTEYMIGEQPCQNFTPNQEEKMWWGHPKHECPRCGGLRMFCSNCHKDHHEGGWEICDEKVSKMQS